MRIIQILMRINLKNPQKENDERHLYDDALMEVVGPHYSGCKASCDTTSFI